MVMKMQEQEIKHKETVDEENEEEEILSTEIY